MPEPHSRATIRTLHLHSGDAFGVRVAEIARTLAAPCMVVTHTRPPAAATDNLDPRAPSAWPVADMHAIVSSRPYEPLTAPLERWCFETGSPLVSIALESARLRVGPVVVPGCGACHGCFEKRRRQHAANPEIEAAREQFYRADPGVRLAGHLDPFADIAAVRLLLVADQIGCDPSSVAGTVWQVDLFSHNLTQSRVVGVHGCPRCGLGVAEEVRSTNALRQALESWLPAPQAVAALAGGGRP